jgi:hypothetical protein
VNQPEVSDYDYDQFIQLRCSAYHREKLRRLARANERTMSAEIRAFISNAPEPATRRTTSKRGALTPA